jgi:hypothetical protein
MPRSEISSLRGSTGPPHEGVCLPTGSRRRNLPRRIRRSRRRESPLPAGGMLLTRAATRAPPDNNDRAPPHAASSTTAPRGQAHDTPATPQRPARRDSTSTTNGRTASGGDPHAAARRAPATRAAAALPGPRPSRRPTSRRPRSERRRRHAQRRDPSSAPRRPGRPPPRPCQRRHHEHRTMHDHTHPRGVEAAAAPSTQPVDGGRDLRAAAITTLPTDPTPPASAEPQLRSVGTFAE